MKKLIVLSAIFLVGCSSFDKSSRLNKFGKDDEGYNSFTNSELNLKSLSFGDIMFASNLQEFKKLNPSKKPDFKNIVVYGKAIYDPIYDYYLLSKNDLSKNDNYITVDSTITNKRLLIKISKNIPKEDYKFIIEHITSIQ